MNIKRSSKVIMALLLAASALFTTELMAQDLKKPTLEDLLSGGETYRIIENLPNLRWMGLMAKEDYADHAEQVRAEVAELCKRFPLYQE